MQQMVRTWPDSIAQQTVAQLHLAEGAAANNFDVSLPGKSDAVRQILKDPHRLDFTELSARPAERDLGTRSATTSYGS
ncbi:hypothetical protein ABZ154_33560 [Streptomyces sp. NPDC006261]|uniref:hypothetical protein n=1 Tax=Streptomyces sp. NPDC006261 TaxID=3156739 RepID=UPI0033A80EFB